MIDLTIKTLDSRNHKFRVPDTFTVLELKEHIAEQVNVAVVQQRLIFCGRVLSNETKLADIGIDGKVMHLVQKVPRLASTTTGTSSSSSTTTNTNSRLGQGGIGPGFRGWHAHDPTVVFGAIGIPSDFMHVREIPRPANNRNNSTRNRLSMAMDMIQKSNAILDTLENPSASQNEQASTNDTEQQPPEQFSEEPTQDEAAGESFSDALSPPTQPDQDSVNVSYEVDETYPNTVVVTIDATHHMRMPQGLMQHMQNQLNADSANQLNADSANQLNADSANPVARDPNEQSQAVEDEAASASVNVSTQSSTTQPQAEQVAASTTPAAAAAAAAAEQNPRDDQTAENRSMSISHDRNRLKKLIEELNKLNARFQPFYHSYCQYITDDPQFESADGENGSTRAQSVFNGVSEVMHYISHIYHAISDLKVSFNRPPPRPFQSRGCLLQRGILHTAHSIPVAAVPPPTQQPSSTQTTNSNQSIPSVRAFRLDFMNPEGGTPEPVSVNLTNLAQAEANTNAAATESNAESNNTTNNTSGTSEFPAGTPHSVELMFDLTPGGIRIDSLEAAFVAPNASSAAPNQQPPTAASTQSTTASSEVPPPNNMSSMPIDWMDQMIDVISSGVRRPFMPDQPLDWVSVPTTSTRTPRVTPRTTDSSSTSNTPSSGISSRERGNSRLDPFLPCSSHHFESHLRSMVLARRPRGTSAGNNSSSSPMTPASPPEMRQFTGRRRNRPFDDQELGFGLHVLPIPWGRNRNNVATTSANNTAAQTTPQQASGGASAANTIAGQIRVGMESVFSTIEREALRSRDANGQPANISVQGLESQINTDLLDLRGRDELLFRTIGTISFFTSMAGRSVLMDIFLTIAREWTLHDILYLNTRSEQSSIVQHPVSRHRDALTNFVLDRIMLNQPPTNANIEDAANRIYQELLPYVNVIHCSVTIRSNVDFGATILRYITLNLRGIVFCCTENRAGASNDIVTSLSRFCQGLFSILIYCCNNRSVFRLNVAALLRFLPLPVNLQRLVMNNARLNIDRYWEAISDFNISVASICNYIVPSSGSSSQAQPTLTPNPEQSSNSNAAEANDPLPEVVLGSQEWHHSVPPEWVPVISRDSQRQRRQGAQPPYSDAYLSGMPNKRRKIVTNSKPQGSLSQIITKNLEVAMGAAGVAVNKEVTASVGADTAVQNAYTERIRTFGRSGLDTHPDFSPDRYPNASKFFYNHNRQN
ncbi:large proline-rich protein BAG6 isoform X2 [Adelges cooleyi]|uniref:large proline-rich protein BAG6 isoform X2 n=1 Tax=Adelges cooleyi TaxID=133065 RepID=UPI00217FEE40|nr:large proline-rich protein BAG6 isoform X2 [Adelges cooleyi]